MTGPRGMLEVESTTLIDLGDWVEETAGWVVVAIAILGVDYEQ